MPAVPNVPSVPTKPTVPTSLWKESNDLFNQYKFPPSTSADKRNCIWKGKKRKSISALANLTENNITQHKSDNVHDVATT